MDLQKINPLWIILPLSLLIIILFVFSTPLKIWDETVYLNLGKDMSNGNDYSFEGGWSDFVPCQANDAKYCWPNAGFRAPLLPVFIAIFNLMRIGNLSIFIVPIFSVLCLGLIYLFTKKLFNKKIALVSTILTMVPIFVYYSSKTLTDSLVCFFVVLSFLFFWKGFEEDNHLYKFLFGTSFALSVLSRYTSLWFVPIFFVYLLYSKGVRFLIKKETYYSLLGFFILMIPHFIYSYKYYGNIFGAFLHGFLASSYWGGIQSTWFYFSYWFSMFSVVGIIFIFSIAKIIYKKEILDKRFFMLILWVCGFFLIASLMPHKEDRFILPLLPAISIISSYFIVDLKHWKKYLTLIMIILLLSIGLKFDKEYSQTHTEKNYCFILAMDFVEKSNASIVISDESPIVYYYTGKPTRFYPNSFSGSAEGAVIFTSYDMGENNDRNNNYKEELDKNFNKVFSCELGQDFSYVYLIP